MTLHQTEFREALLDPQRSRPRGLEDGSQRPAGRRFDVYRNNVAVSLTEALETAFPVLKKLLGTNSFHTLAGVFLRRHPPKSPLMMFYGDEMPDFLKTFGPTSQIGYLPDVARLELALRESYHAADSVPVDPTILQHLATEELLSSRITFAPSLRLIRSCWPIHAIWKFNTEPGAPKPTMESQDVAVFRAEFDPEPHRLPPGGAALLVSLANGRPLERALDDAISETADFDFSSLLTLLISTGAITSIGG